MKRRTSCKVGWRRASLAILVGALLCAAFALTACGGNTAQSSSSAASSAASSSAASSSEASSSASSSSEASSTAASSEASQSSAGKQFSEVYVPVKIVTKFRDGATQTITNTFDDRGKQLSNEYELVDSEATRKIVDTYTDWDEFGHVLKINDEADLGDGNPIANSTEATDIQVNENGFMTSAKFATTVKKESFEEGEAATENVTQTVEYGDDAAILRKFVRQAEDYDQTGKLFYTNTQTYEYDEDGLQTSYIEKVVGADGVEQNGTLETTWTKDESGKPTSFKFVITLDGETTETTTADVTLNEQGLISSINNLNVNGEPSTTTVEFTYQKIDNPMQNAYEGWKCISLNDALVPVF